MTNGILGRRFYILVVLLGSLWSLPAESRWSENRADQWYNAQPWPVGCNYIPSTAINQLEMWQADTFDPVTIDRELGWSQQLGFNTARVFLHDLLWREDAKGFLKRIDQFLGIARRHHIRVMFVLLDGVWDPFPKAGKQRDPKPFVHNSGWVQSPGAEILKDPSRHDELRGYIQGVIRRFKSDKRVLAWDLFNEPDNTNRRDPANKAAMSLILLNRAFAWAREVHPRQPLTTGVWGGKYGADDELSPVDKTALAASDVITFHSYASIVGMRACVQNLRRFHRPLICTEYMARTVGSTFDPVLGYLKFENVGACNWGLVSGKTQTIYPWDSWTKHYTAEPVLWFHDIFRSDGTPFSAKEVEFIRSVTMPRHGEVN